VVSVLLNKVHAGFVAVPGANAASICAVTLKVPAVTLNSNPMSPLVLLAGVPPPAGPEVAPVDTVDAPVSPRINFVFTDGVVPA